MPAGVAWLWNASNQISQQDLCLAWNEKANENGNSKHAIAFTYKILC